DGSLVCCRLRGMLALSREIRTCYVRTAGSARGDAMMKRRQMDATRADGACTMAIKRKFHIENLVRELAENRVNPLEIIREALSNAKDHKATRVWVRTTKDQRNEVSVIIIDDGEGMDEHRLAAFWGVGASIKSQQGVIGYKGHGTKLYFDCRRLSV